MRPIETFAYQRIADTLRQEILDGQHPPGSVFPTVAQLAARFKVSSRTISEAQKILFSEGLLTSKPGARTHVREQPELIRMVHSWAADVPAGSPWRAMMAAAGRVGDWESHSAPVSAPPDVAARLLIAPEDRVMRTEYVFTADGIPAYLSVSCEPMTITGGTPILLPESGLYAGLGVVDRMARIGVLVTRETHDIDSRPLTEAEAAKLGLRAGVSVVVKTRTYWAGELPVETAEIVLPSHVRLRYEILVPPLLGE